MLYSHGIYHTVVEFVFFTLLGRFYWTVHYPRLVIVLMGFRSCWTEKRDDIMPLSSMYLQQDKAKLVTFTTENRAAREKKEINEGEKLVPSSCEVGDHRRALRSSYLLYSLVYILCNL